MTIIIMPYCIWMFSIGSFIVTWLLTSIGVFSDNQFSLYWEQAYCLSRQTLPILFQLRCDIGVVTLHICSDNRAMYSYTEWWFYSYLNRKFINYIWVKFISKFHLLYKLKKIIICFSKDDQSWHGSIILIVNIFIHRKIKNINTVLGKI